MTIDNAGNDLVGCIAKMTIKNVRDNLNRANASDSQVQFVDDTAGNNHQNVLSIRIDGIQNKGVSVLPPLTDRRIGASNQLALSISNGILQAP